MALSVLTIQIKKRDKHLVTSPHCYSYSLASQPPELVLYALLNSPEHYNFDFVGALISYSMTSHLPYINVLPAHLFICLFLLLFQILRTYFFKLLLFIKFGRLVFFMILCHSYLTFGIQLIFPQFVHLLFLSLKRIYSTNIIYLISLK